MIYFFGKLHPYFLSPKHYGGQAPASNAPGEGEGDIEPVIEEPVLPSEAPAEDPGPAEPVEEPVVDDDDIVSRLQYLHYSKMNGIKNVLDFDKLFITSS